MLIALFVLFVVLSAADGYTTWKALQRNGTKEANPVMAWLFDRFGVVPSLVVVKGAAIIVVLVTMGPYSMWVLPEISAFYAYIVWRNYYKVGVSK